MSVFKNKPVAKMTFLPKKSGEYVFSIKEKIGKESTGFVNAKSERITPNFYDLKVKVK